MFTILKAIPSPLQIPSILEGSQNQVVGFCNCFMALLQSATIRIDNIDIYIMPSFFYRYVDVILQLIDKAGNFVSDDIWFRVVQFVTNNEDLQVSMKLELTVAAS
jgi:hypothetical protein